MKFIKSKAPGIAVCALIAAVSTLLAEIKIASFSFEVIGAPVFSILAGMIITALFSKFAKSKTFSGGLTFTSKKILQWAVIILGFTLNIKLVAQVGASSLPVIIATISTSLLAAFIMCKVLRIDSKTAVLIGVGSSICGGSEIAATAPVIDADDDEIARSISVIFLFNVIAALIFPTFGNAIGLSNDGFALFAGTAVNDTSSVTAAASAWDSMKNTDGAVLARATTVKLTRTLAIIPITLVLAFVRTKKAKKSGSEASKVNFKKIFPWFILFFVAASLITTLISLLPANGFTDFYNDSFVKAAKWLAKFFIAMAMAAIGLNTNIIDLIKKGGKPIALGFTCWAAITGVSLLMQHILGYW